MITQEIKLYEEPKPTVYTPPANSVAGTTYKTFSWDEIQIAIEEAAQIGVSVGLRFKYKNQTDCYKIEKINSIPHKLFVVSNAPAIFDCHRYDKDGNKLSVMTMPFSLPEIIAENKEILW